ncbi:hypothetical protein [Nonomuraea guangzhouensis]|uniref:hypothetical protein n=1 Tax=Nonomuraea guangzhouensis TaxID=1291555 RepID=UPI001FEC1741|nr:hypothetical protein [Nonomuraea guangzhouensis]
MAASQAPINKAGADSAYRTTVIDNAAEAGIDVEVVTRDPTTRDLTPLPDRWVAERALGRLMLRRRFVRDNKALPTRSEAGIHIAMIDLMASRLTGENTPHMARHLNPGSEWIFWTVPSSRHSAK